MATQKEIIRNLLIYEYQLGHDAQTAAANVNRAKGPKTVHQATAFRWFAKFRDDNTSLIEHLRRELTNWFESKDDEFYERGIDLLPERWQECVENDGEYFV